MKTVLRKSILLLFIFLIIFMSSQSQNIATGGWHSLAICNDSTVKAFGENASGQIGDGTTTDRTTPTTVAGLSGIVAVSAGGDQLEAHSTALKRNGTLWSWGSNLYGALGSGSLTNTLTPLQTLNLNNIAAISTGGWHSVALKSDGTVWTWGWNSDGQLGDGSTSDKNIPAQVPSLSGIIKIAAGTYHVLALKNDGTVWAWGDNISGQIGNATTTDQKTPTQVSGLTNIVAITAGRFFSMAVKNDGTVWTWGENLYGQLGNGTLVNSSVPVQVMGLSDASTRIASGAFHCLVVKNDNTLWSWGRNTYGNLGNNTLINSSTPIQINGLTNVERLAAGTNFSLFYTSVGALWGCGRNASGQLGDGTFLQRNIPTQASALCTVQTPLGISNGPLQSIQLHAYPNPSSEGMFHLLKTSAAYSGENLKITVLNCAAQILQTLEMNSDAETLDLNLSPSAPGLYFIIIEDKGRTSTLKLIKE